MIGLRFSFVVFLAVALLVAKVSSLVAPWRPMTITTSMSRVVRGVTRSNDEEDHDDVHHLASVYFSSTFEPYQYFQMQQIPTSTWTAAAVSASSRLDQVVDCAEHGVCSVDEMTDMIEELERLNAECTSESSMSRECHLDAVAARNILKLALASKVMLEQEEARQRHANTNDHEDHNEEDDPYASMRHMDDDVTTRIHGIPTALTSCTDRLDRIVQCAQDGDHCDVMEITEMIEELERLNQECEGTMSRQCNLDAVTARNILKVALASQAAVMAQRRVHR